MIVESLLHFAVNFIQMLFSGLHFVSLPLDLLTVLFDILCYGTWIVGADLMAIALASIAFWMATRFTMGLALFVWRLIPLT